MKQLAVVLLFLLQALPCSAASTAIVPEPGSGICPVMLRHYYSVDGTNDYDATLSADDSAEYTGSITLFSDTDAYEATFDHVRIDGRARILIRMPSHVRIDYASMDTGGKGDAPATSCPTFIVRRKMSEGAPPLPAAAARPAVLRGPLPQQSCGQMWSDAEMYKPPERFMYAPVPKPTTAVLHMYVDSAGHVFAPDIVISSGDATIDAQAVMSARRARFRPAKFLCEPVISEVGYTFTFDPA